MGSISLPYTVVALHDRNEEYPFLLMKPSTFKKRFIDYVDYLETG
jgi:hypothetical protein